MINELARANRSYRRFKQHLGISADELTDLIQLASMIPSSRNQQALKFSLINSPEDCARVYPHLAWAGYLKDWAGPEEGQRPSAYLMIYGDSQIGNHFEIDTGIAAQTILLAAAEKGLGGCMIGSIQRKKLRTEFSIPEHLEIILVLALGYPDEKILLEPMQANEIKYYRTPDGVHHVPKRDVQEIIVAL